MNRIEVVANITPDLLSSEAERLVAEAAERNVLLNAEKHFDAWWQSIPLATRMEMDGFSAWRSFKEGWLSMAREFGHLTGGNANSRKPKEQPGEFAYVPRRKS